LEVSLGCEFAAVQEPSMRFRVSSRHFFFAACLLLSCLATTGQEPALRKRIAVLNFDNPSLGADAPSGLFGADGDNVGKGVSVLLIQRLVEGDAYTVVDRSALEQLLQEQTDEDRSAMDPYAMAAKIGRLLDLDALIIGAVTRYGPDDSQKSRAVHGLPSAAGVRIRKSKAHVEITARVFNVTTGEIMGAFTSAGESAQLGEITIIAARGQAKTSPEMLGSDFVNSLFPEATRNAVDQLSFELNRFAERIPVLHIAVEGQVAEVAGNTVTLSINRHSGLHVGDQLRIIRDARAAASPGKPNTSQPVPSELVGVLTIITVSEDSATGTVPASVEARMGDRVQSVGVPPTVVH
jgi:curli biogenesis system outer membrane secretion channel CsgG